MEVRLGNGPRPRRVNGRRPEAEQAPAAVAALARWTADPAPERFPYDTVVDCVHDVGKEFVPGLVLDALAAARSRVWTVAASTEEDFLRRFLDILLDKRDGRFDYLTYLALPLLPLPSVDEAPAPIQSSETRHDLLLVRLAADVARFEIAAADGVTGMLPEDRPARSVLAKRLRHARSAMRPAALRLGLPIGPPAEDPATAIDAVARALAGAVSPADRRALRLSILPVATLHDEYLFIRVLQCFENTFAFLAVLFADAVRELTDGDTPGAVRSIGHAERTLRAAAPLFSLLATMRGESFRAFRVHTEGASAIQSRNYKLMESLCRPPDADRVDSAAYVSVPDVRRRVLVGQSTIDDLVALADQAERATLQEAMRGFEEVLRRWRATHYRLAVRMLGDDKPGTGYTEGTPYLRAARDVPVFRSVHRDCH